MKLINAARFSILLPHKARRFGHWERKENEDLIGEKRHVYAPAILLYDFLYG